MKTKSRTNALPPIIMEVEIGSLQYSIFVSFHLGVLFHFHDYGRKGTNPEISRAKIGSGQHRLFKESKLKPESAATFTVWVSMHCSVAASPLTTSHAEHNFFVPRRRDGRAALIEQVAVLIQPRCESCISVQVHRGRKDHNLLAIEYQRIFGAATMRTHFEVDPTVVNEEKFLSPRVYLLPPVLGGSSHSVMGLTNHYCY